MKGQANFGTKMTLFHFSQTGDSDHDALSIINEISSIQEELINASKSKQADLQVKLKKLKAELSRVKISGILQKAIGDYIESEPVIPEKKTDIKS